MDMLEWKSFLQTLMQINQLQPENGVTHCNQAARMAAQQAGCNEFDNPDLLADDMIRIMEDNLSGKWAVNDGPRASLQAINGGLAFAGMSSKDLGEEHGHIAVIFPGQMEFSGSLNKDVPVIANVGKRNGVMKVSEAFPVDKREPKYWRWS
ncbi:MAG: hypothetical protein KGL39_20040 [Patescibacteria group bacterium]|nr:hypothetical protein [Patescibacteria group bacterium]